MSKKILHGNKARVEPIKSIIPAYITNTITPKKAQLGNDVPMTIEENAILAKEYVDENHK